MSGSSWLLIIGGLSLAAFGMLYGLHYAVFVEHQTLDHLGGSLAQSFSYAADHQWAKSRAALNAYGQTKYDYVRQVDAHSHWIGLAMLMIVLGMVFHRVNFGEGVRQAETGQPRGGRRFGEHFGDRPAQSAAGTVLLERHDRRGFAGRGQDRRLVEWLHGVHAQDAGPYAAAIEHL